MNHLDQTWGGFRYSSFWTFKNVWMSLHYITYWSKSIIYLDLLERDSHKWDDELPPVYSDLYCPLLDRKHITASYSFFSPPIHSESKEMTENDGEKRGQQDQEVTQARFEPITSIWEPQLDVLTVKTSSSLLVNTMKEAVTMRFVHCLPMQNSPLKFWVVTRVLLCGC